MDEFEKDQDELTSVSQGLLSDWEMSARYSKSPLFAS